MGSAEKCSLAWEDFQQNAGGTFRDLREDGDFCDVSLVCEDNQQIPGHKVVLAASSPLLKSMLKSSQHSHPLLYFWGIKARDLSSLVDFIYRGQVQVYQSDLGDFLNLAKVLKVKGVSEGKTGKEMNSRLGKEVKTDKDRATKANYLLLPETIKVLTNDPVGSTVLHKDSSATSNVIEGVAQNTMGPIWDCFTIDVNDNTIVTCNQCENKLRRETGNKALHNHMRIHAQKDEDTAWRQVLETARGREDGIMVPITQPIWEGPIHQPVLKQERDQDLESSKENIFLENKEDQEFNGIKIGMDALKNWYTIDETDLTKAYCKVCPKQVSRGKTGCARKVLGNKGLKIHLKSTHPNEFKVLLKTCKEQIDLTKEMLCKE